MRGGGEHADVFRGCFQGKFTVIKFEDSGLQIFLKRSLQLQYISPVALTYARSTLSIACNRKITFHDHHFFFIFNFSFITHCIITVLFPMHRPLIQVTLRQSGSQRSCTLMKPLQHP